MFLVLLGVLLCGLGAAWLAYNDEANESVRGVRERAETAVHQAEDEAYGLLDTFEARLAAAEMAATPDKELAKAADAMIVKVEELVEQASKDVYALAEQLARYPALASRETNVVMLKHLEGRCETVVTRANDVVRTARDRGRAALVAGEKAHKSGHFVEARKQLTLARNLAFDDEAFAARAATLLTHVNKYLEDFGVELARLEEIRATGDLTATFACGVQILAKYLDSDMTRSLRLPVQVRSQPGDAKVRIGGADTGATTPCVVEYSPFDATELAARLPGRVPQSFQLPSYDQIIDSPTTMASWTPQIEATLPTGPAWRLPAGHGPFSSLWRSGRVPVLLTADGESLVMVNIVTREIEQRRGFRRPNPVRRAGAIGRDHEWRIFGQRTLAVLPPGGKPWELSFLGRLDRTPCLAGGMVIVIDELGTLYGLDSATGQQHWRQSLGSAPTQDPLPSDLGVLVSTVAGGAVAVNPETGQSTPLPVDARGFSLALPFAGGAVVLGGGTDQVRVVDHEGNVTRRGSAAPLGTMAPWVSHEGVAWREADGVHWLGIQDPEPVHVSGLGPVPTGVTGRDGELYAGGTDGIVRCVGLDDPTTARWRTPVGGPVTGAPVPLADQLCVLAGDELVVINR